METNEVNIEKAILPKRIFILEDEADIAELISLTLKNAGYVTRIFHLAEQMMKALKEEIPDLLVLDLMLPDIDGIEVCKYIRKNTAMSTLPIIMLTAKAEEFDKVLGLELGADDYMTKPFSTRELLARIKAVLRREQKAEERNTIKINDILSIDYQKFEVYVDGGRVELTGTEFKLLKMLLTKKGWVYSRSQILDYLDANDKGVLDRTVDVHVKNLREKLGDAGRFIKNIRGIGYKFEG